MNEPIDFGAADAAALQHLQGGSERPSGTTPAGESTPQQSSQQAATVPQGTPSVAQIAEDALVELVVNGQKVTKPWKQARSEMMLHEDYTRKRQAESEEVKQAREAVEAIKRRDEAYKQLISDERNIIALYEAVTKKKFTPEGQRPAPQGDELVTAEDIQRTREELKGETEEVVQQAIQQFRDQVFMENVTQMTNSTINAILEERKELSKFLGDDAAVLIKRMAREKKPADQAELKAALIEAGDKLHQRIVANLQESAKESAVKQAKLTKQGIEPPGGTGVPVGPKSYGEGKQVNWGDIDKDAQAFLESRLNR